MEQIERNSIYRPGFRLLTGILIVAAISIECMAQQRDADSIFTIKKDTLTVRIIEVGIDAIKYTRPGGDSVRIYSMAKSEISSVTYGNGETETYETRVPNADQTQKYRYVQPVKTSAFQQTISTWPNDLLITKQKEYQTTANIALATGIVTSAASPILIVGGFITTIFDSEKRGTPYLVGGLLGLGASVSLFLGTAKNKKKSRTLQMELLRRNAINY
jgi:hypothetical protein